MKWIWSRLLFWLEMKSNPTILDGMIVGEHRIAAFRWVRDNPTDIIAPTNRLHRIYNSRKRNSTHLSHIKSYATYVRQNVCVCNRMYRRPTWLKLAENHLFVLAISIILHYMLCVVYNYGTHTKISWHKINDGNIIKLLIFFTYLKSGLWKVSTLS